LEFRLGKVPFIKVKGEITKLILKAQTEDETSMLHAAAQNVCVKVIESLLDYNADFNSRVSTYITPLPIAAQKDHPEVVEILLKFGASIDSKYECGRTPLHFAAQKGHLEVVEVLLKFGASIDSKDEDGRTALHIACKEWHQQIVIVLLEQGSDINIMSKNNKIPIYFAVGCFRSELHMYEFNHGHGSHVFQTIANILKCHRVKMKTANLFLSEKNL
jgi:ankyrin repeat protein